MSKQLYHLRFESKDVDRVKLFAEKVEKPYTKVMRDFVNEQIDNKNSSELHDKLIEIIAQLRKSIPYIKSADGYKRALKQKLVNETLAERLETTFGLK